VVHTAVNLQNNTVFVTRQSYVIQKPNPRGTFSFRIPPKHIFGFCDDHEKFYMVKSMNSFSQERVTMARFSKPMQVMMERLF